MTASSFFASSCPTIAASWAREMFSSWPVTAFVAGVKIGSRSCSDSRSPGGIRSPTIVPIFRYSAQADPLT